MKAHEFLKQGQTEMEDRAVTYDNPEGERSMGKTVAMFNALTGLSMTEEQGWKFMVCLKLVRSEQGEFRGDNFIDGAAYFALAGETGSGEGVIQKHKCQGCGQMFTELVSGGLCRSCFDLHNKRSVLLGN